MKLYGLKNCDTCKKALKALEAASKSVEFVDIRADERVNGDLIGKWLSKSGQKKLLNTRSTSWRNLSDAEKNIETEEQALSLITKNPTLIKRPVIEVNDTIFVGWGKEEQQSLL